jgi:hypothetical protein
MMEETIQKLNSILEKAPKLLLEMNEASLSLKELPDKWSKKEILGHLIDSATNNHHRIIRAQFELNPEVVYDQNEWNKFNFYQEIESLQIIHFWIMYNRQLVEIIRRIPKSSLSKQVSVHGSLLTLEYSIRDYVEHLEHHLRQIIDL